MTFTGGCQGILYIEVYHSHLERLSPKKTCIIDATELFTERHSDRGLQTAFFSSYKHHHTVKALVAISPCGHVMFVSRLVTGPISDRELTKESGFLNNFCAWRSSHGKQRVCYC